MKVLYKSLFGWLNYLEIALWNQLTHPKVSQQQTNIVPTKILPIDRSSVTSVHTSFESCGETNHEKKENLHSLQLFTQKNFDVKIVVSCLFVGYSCVFVT